MIHPPPSPMQRVTQERQKEYLDDPTKCPNCKGPIRMGKLKRPKSRKTPQGGRLRLRFEVKCPRCKTELVEFYEMVSVAAKR